MKTRANQKLFSMTSCFLQNIVIKILAFKIDKFYNRRI